MLAGGPQAWEAMRVVGGERCGAANADSAFYGAENQKHTGCWVHKQGGCEALLLVPVSGEECFGTQADPKHQWGGIIPGRGGGKQAQRVVNSKAARLI